MKKFTDDKFVEIGQQTMSSLMRHCSALILKNPYIIGKIIVLLLVLGFTYHFKDLLYLFISKRRFD